MKDPKVSRRTVLLGTTVGQAGAMVPGMAEGADLGVSVLSFPLSAVTLPPGPFHANRDRTLSYPSFVDAGRLLHAFRLNVGLPSSAHCQSRATQAGFHAGCLSAYPESFIDRVEARQTAWAPYDDRLQGNHANTGNTRCRDIAVNFRDSEISQLP